MQYDNSEKKQYFFKINEDALMNEYDLPLFVIESVKKQNYSL